MKFATVHSILVLVAASVLITPPGTAHAQRKFKLETKISRDSTRFSLKLEPGAKPTAGKTFQARIHVKPGIGWHVWSASMSSDGGLVPLTLRVPDSISKYFAITAIKEYGKAHVDYDSNFMTETRGYHEPYDIVVTVKVRENSPAPVPFSLWVNFQTCDETMCLPPRTFAIPMTVLGEKPIDLTIARGKADTTVQAGWPVIQAGDKSSLVPSWNEERSNGCDMDERRVRG